MNDAELMESLKAEMLATIHAEFVELPRRVADELERRSKRNGEPALDKILAAIENRFGHKAFTVREACADPHFREILLQIHPASTPITIGRLFGKCSDRTSNDRTLRRDGILDGV